MKKKLIESLTKKQLRLALERLGVDGCEKKPLAKLQELIEPFSYNKISEALK